MKSSIEAKLPRSPPCTSSIGNYMKNTRVHIFDPWGRGGSMIFSLQPINGWASGSACGWASVWVSG